MTNDRNFGLDVMRCIAIMLVLVAHGEYLFYDSLPGLLGNNLILTGHWGVQLFFVLSGFLIGSILLRDIIHKGVNKAIIVNFWKRRWFRTLPNYYLFLIIYLVIYLVVPADFLAGKRWEKNFTNSHPHTFAYYPFFLQNFKTMDVTFLGHSWSLAVEEWFYLLLPCAIFIFSPHLAKGKFKHSLLLMLLILIPLLMAMRMASVWGVFFNYDRLSVIYNFDNLLLGVLFAWLFTYYKLRTLTWRNRLLVISILLFLVAFVIQNKFILTGKPLIIWEGVIIPTQAMAFACAIPWFYSINVKKSSWISRLITEISIVSYSMYLVHFIVLVFIIDSIKIYFGIKSGLGGLLLFVLFIAITILISSFNYRFYERKMTALRNKFSRE